MPDQLPPVDTSTFKPIAGTFKPLGALPTGYTEEPITPTTAGLPPVDMSTFKPIAGTFKPLAALPTGAQATGENVAEGFGSAAATTLSNLGSVGSHIPGVQYVAGKVGDVLGLPKLAPGAN